jgi:tight adherence protein C
MEFAIAAFVGVFLLVAIGGVLLFQRHAMVHRISSAINPAPPKSRTLKGIVKDTGSSLGGVVGVFKHVLPKSQTEISVTRERLQRAGYRNDSAVNMLNGSKVLVPLLLCTLALVTGFGKFNPFVIYISALGIGFILPDFWLGRKIKARQKRIRRGLPDVLDMLVICTEAGLSLDQATARTSAELLHAQPDLCDELGIVVLEQRAGRARSDAWKQMADRTGVDSLRNLVSMLVQSEQFGTSIAKTMRTHSDTLRTQRVQAVEEQAAKTSVKLVFPLVFFIFPALFIVTLGPAVILMMESFKQLMNH